MLEHTIDDMHQLAHHGSYHHLLGFSAGRQPLRVRPTAWTAPHGCDRRPIQCCSQSLSWLLTSSAVMRFFAIADISAKTAALIWAERLELEESEPDSWGP